jgi:urea transport system permease protein
MRLGGLGQCPPRRQRCRGDGGPCGTCLLRQLRRAISGGGRRRGRSACLAETRIGINQTIDLALDALSLASIYFLAAIGLAITFGVMGVINMAHGEFIMMGAYTGYVVQLIVPGLHAVDPAGAALAFAVTFAAGVAMERLVIRRLYHRPLETLLATFGISIALQQLAKNIFGTQARPLTSPAWLDGALTFNDVVSISYIRIAIFVLALIFLAVFLFILKRTRLGLEVRAVTAEPAHGREHGDQPRPDQHADLRPRLRHRGHRGRGHRAFRQVTSEMGSDYIVQSFMTVVVGGVGNIWGTLAGRHADRLPAEGDRVAQPVEHAGGADLHDPLHHHLHPVPAAGHHRPQGPRGGGLT